MSEEQLYFQDAPVSELCGCVSIALTESEQGRLARAQSQARRDALMKRFLEGGRDRSYDAQCPNCDMGIKAH